MPISFIPGTWPLRCSPSWRRLGFLSFNGDLAVMTTIMLIAGSLLALVTFGLFELIDIGLEDFNTRYLLIWGLPAAPIIGTYLVRTNPQLVNRVSPVIAGVFTPLVLAMLVIYLVAVARSYLDIQLLKNNAVQEKPIELLIGVRDDGFIKGLPMRLVISELLIPILGIRSS